MSCSCIDCDKVTKACTTCSPFWSRTPTTCALDTDGQLSSTRITSLGSTLRPPTLITWSLRHRQYRKPSASSTPRSPVQYSVPKVPDSPNDPDVPVTSSVTYPAATALLRTTISPSTPRPRSFPFSPTIRTATFFSGAP